MAPRIVVLGEPLVEFLRSGVDQPLDREGQFQGPFPSGAPAICAAALRRLGLPTGFIGGIGSDAFGRMLKERLKHEGIDLAGLLTIPHRTTAMAFVSYASDGSREFVFHLRDSAAGAVQADDLDMAWLAGKGWLHLSGSTVALNRDSAAACWRAVELAKAAGRRISFDPNLRPELMPLDEARQFLRLFIESADLLAPTAEEARALTGLSDDDQVAEALCGGRECVLAIKRGADGCSLFSAGTRCDARGYTVNEVDATGAGDCFNAACIFGLEMGCPPAQVAQFANAAGALAVTRRGPMEGAATVEEIGVLVSQQSD